MISILSIFTFIGSILLSIVTAKVGLNYLKTKDVQSLRLTEFYFFTAIAFFIYSLPGIIVFSAEQIIASRFLVFFPLIIGFTILNDLISKLVYSPPVAKITIWLVGGVSLILNLVGFKMFSHGYHPIKIGDFLFHPLQPTDWGQIIAALATIFIISFSFPALVKNSIQSAGIAKKRAMSLSAAIAGGAIGMFILFVLINFMQSDNSIVLTKIIGVLMGTVASTFNFIGFVVLRKEEEAGLDKI